MIPVEMRLADFLEIVHKIRQLLQKANIILDLPDLNNPEQVYTWCRMVLVLASELAKLTRSTVDDQIVSWLLLVPFASFEAFQPYYQVFRSILELLKSDEPAESVATRAVELGGADAADLLASNPLNLNPVTLIVILVKIIRLILALRS